jgi:regulator of replication initiation timing
METVRKVITLMRATKTRGFSPNAKLLDAAEFLLAALATETQARQEAEKKLETTRRDVASLEERWETHDSAVCPEDVGCVEYIGILERKLTAERTARQQAERELAQYRGAFTVCDAHTPEQWESDGSCVICEGGMLKDSLTASEQSRETLRTALEPLARKEHDRAVHANALFSVEHWKHNAGPDWPHEPDDDSFAAFENCKHPLCALAASQPAGMTTKPDG